MYFLLLHIIRKLLYLIKRCISPGHLHYNKFVNIFHNCFKYVRQDKFYMFFFSKIERVLHTFDVVKPLTHFKNVRELARNLATYFRLGELLIGSILIGKHWRNV